MDPATIADLPTLISPPRLAPYLTATSGQAEALRLYTWNVEVSSAFWGVVNALEVALRNSMQDQLATRFGRRDWWGLPSAKLAREQAGQLSQARKAASKAAKARKRAVVPDDVVAQFMLGFWVGLLGKGSPYQYETLYWQPTLRHAFPNFVGPRGSLQETVNAVRLFRNRIAHHEPIFGRNLVRDHDRIVRIGGYIHASCASYIDSHSRVAEVLGRRKRAVDFGYSTRF